jgi:hypothetical protein
VEKNRNPPPRRARLSRGLSRLALGASLALAAGALVPRAVYLSRLAAAPDARARGALAAAERVSPLTTAGNVLWRRALARSEREGRAGVSGFALAWSFFVEARPQLPPESRVLLTLPHDALYQVGNFLLFPTRLEVAPRVSSPLADTDDLRRAAAGRACSESRWLLGQGYAGCVDDVDARLRLVTTGASP